MPNNLKFPSSVEIKRMITAAIRAGIEIGSIEIHPRKVIIRPKEQAAAPIGDYDTWKIDQGLDTDRVKHSVEETDAFPKKPIG